MLPEHNKTKKSTSSRLESSVTYGIMVEPKCISAWQKLEGGRGGCCSQWKTSGRSTGEDAFFLTKHFKAILLFANSLPDFSCEKLLFRSHARQRTAFSLQALFFLPYVFWPSAVLTVFTLLLQATVRSSLCWILSQLCECLLDAAPIVRK